LSPLAEQFLHAIQQHHHVACENKQKQHLCSQKEKCEICSFQFQNGEIKKEELHLHNIMCFKQKQCSVYRFELNQVQGLLPSRAPPAIVL
jgi:hypothetical protein